ncbi:hypothetical protein BBJ28_00011471 [Nothophytophthora sp. Chile5]|nr:hypothetical protein BBJ28_00011471 [Nothophytophthora sp. Chile5]
MAILRTIALLASAGFAAVAAQDTVMLGTWTAATVTDADVSLLVEAAGNSSNYSPSVTTAICLIAVEGLETQTVAGTNYKFQVAGCAVDSVDGLGACVNRDCATADYDVIVFSQPWTNTLQVTSVTQLS